MKEGDITRMAVSSTIQDGIYDNRQTLARERWEKGGLKGSISAKQIVEQRGKGLPLEWWGSYSDVPWIVWRFHKARP